MNNGAYASYANYVCRQCVVVGHWLTGTCVLLLVPQQCRAVASFQQNLGGRQQLPQMFPLWVNYPPPQWNFCWQWGLTWGAHECTTLVFIIRKSRCNDLEVFLW